MSRSTPTLADVLGLAMDERLDDVHVSLPGRIETYDSATQQATVQPLIKRRFLDEAGVRQVENLPIVTGVPVIFPGAGAYSITWPIAEGDTGLLVFASASLDKWLSEGGLIDPLDDRRHTLTDAVFVPGLRPFKSPIPESGTNSSAVVIRTAGEIHAGGTEELALKSDVESLRSAIAAATNGNAVPGAASAVTVVGTYVLKGS